MSQFELDRELELEAMQASEFLKTVFDEKDLVELRLIETFEENGHRRSRTDYKQSRILAFPQLVGQLQKTLSLAKRNGQNVYFSVCPRAGVKHSKAWQVRTVRCLWSDVDNVCMEEFEQRLEASKLPRPSLINSTGNGIHAYWLLDEPYLIDDAGESLPVQTEWPKTKGSRQEKMPPDEFIENSSGERRYLKKDGINLHVNVPSLSPKAIHLQEVVRYIARRLDGDTVQDLARLLRLPGSWNMKNARNGNSPRLCRNLESASDRVYPLSRFEKIFECELIEAEKRSVDQRTRHGGQGTPQTVMSDQELELAMDYLGHRRAIVEAALEKCEEAEIGERSDADFAYCCVCIKAGLAIEACWSLCQDVGKFAERGESYFRRTYEKARKVVPDAESEFDEITDFEPGFTVSPSLAGKESSTTKLKKQRQLVMNSDFPIDCLPKILREFVIAGSESLNCSRSYIASSALAAVAGTIGATRRVAVKADWVEPCTLWFCLVGPSGDKKSPAMNLALRPLKFRERENYRRHSEEMRKFEIAQREFEIDRKRRHGGLGLEPPLKPRFESRLISDTTLEALADVLETSPRGVLLARDELDAWLGGFDRYTSGKGSDAASWLSIFGADTLIIDRKSTGKRFIARPSVSIIGGIQPSILRSSIRGQLTANGMAHRFLYCMPPRRESPWSDFDIPRPVLTSYANLLEELSRLPVAESLTYDFEPNDLEFVPEARECFKEFHNDVEKGRAESDDTMASMYAKLPGQTARLSLVLELTTNPSASAVEMKSVQDAITLAEWFATESQRVIEFCGGKESDDEFRRLAEWIQQKGGETTVRDLMRSKRRFSTSAEAERALRQLSDAGYGEFQIEVEGAGRPKSVFRLMPALTQFEKTAEK